jgi:hypothetical protein
VLLHFLVSFVKDVLAKDLAPLYLLSFAFLMFGFTLGIFQPLLFTEQWGYSLQQMGNTIAVGVALGLVISLLAGWLADKSSKMNVYFLATVGNLVVNIFYTIYVYFKPDYRPEIWEIIAFGNLAYIFGATKGVVGFPLIMEYVARNRMGAAGAGLTLFNGIFRNTIGLLVGGWLALWSSSANAGKRSRPRPRPPQPAAMTPPGAERKAPAQAGAAVSLEGERSGMAGACSTGTVCPSRSNSMIGCTGGTSGKPIEHPARNGRLASRPNRAMVRFDTVGRVRAVFRSVNGRLPGQENPRLLKNRRAGWLAGPCN